MSNLGCSFKLDSKFKSHKINSDRNNNSQKTHNAVILACGRKLPPIAIFKV